MSGADPARAGDRRRTGEPDGPGGTHGADPVDPTGEAQGPRRRRRATGGTAPHADAEPLLPGRAPDDRDHAWGDPDPDDDERHLREVPPHW